MNETQSMYQILIFTVLCGTNTESNGVECQCKSGYYEKVLGDAYIVGCTGQKIINNLIISLRSPSWQSSF